MKANAIAIGTPPSERYICAATNSARGEISCFARIPPRYAGERRKMCADMGNRVPT